MVTFFLGCLYLTNSLFLAALFQHHLKILGFLFNPVNRKFLLSLELPYIVLCFLALLEQGHWFVMLLLSLHLFNSAILLFGPRNFYKATHDIKRESAPFFLNVMILTLAIAGALCIYVSFL